MSLKDELKQKIKDQIREDMMSNQKKEKSFVDFAGNIKSDIVGFGKGILGLGYQAASHPIESAKTLGSVAKETAKKTVEALPEFGKTVGSIIKSPYQTAKKLKEDVSSLRSISYQEQKKILDNMQKQVAKNTEKMSRGEQIVAGLGAALIADTTKEITHPVEFAYDKPFTFALDVMSVGGGKVLGKTASKIAKTEKGAKVLNSIEKRFVPDAKLKQAGYGDFAKDLAKTKENIFNSQSRIIDSTAKKFEELGLSGKERAEMFKTIDALRRPEKVVKNIAKSTTVENIKRNLKKFGIDNEDLAKTMTKVSNVDDIKNILDKMTGGINSFKAVSKNPKIQSAIDWWIGEEVPKLQRASGLSGDNSITNYLHHFFPEKLKAREMKPSPFKISEKGWLKKSLDKTGFSTDPFVSISAIKTKAAVAALRDSFIGRTIKKYGSDIDNMKTQLASRIGWDEVNRLEDSGKLMDSIKSNFNVDTFNPGKSPYSQPQLLPKEIADELQRFFTPREEGLLTTALNAFNRNWKPLATATRPRYHTRNILGNIWNGSFLGGSSPKDLGRAAYQQIGNYINETRKSKTVAGKIANKLLPKFEGTKYIKMAIKDGVIGRGFFGADLHDVAKMATNADDILSEISKYKNPAEIYKIPGLKQWLQISQNVGSAIEDNARLGLYISQLKKGASRESAKAFVNKHLFDYMTGLGEADKEIKKIIPFWSWTRFNVPLQTEAIVTQSLKHAVINKISGTVSEDIESKDDMRKYLSEKEKEAGFLKIGEEEKNGKIYNKYIKTESVLPINDLTKIVDIFRLDAESLGLHPIVGLIQRLSSNRDYFGQLIERFPGEEKKFLGQSLEGKTVEAAKLIPFLTELDKALGSSYSAENRPELDVRLEQVLSPLGTSLKDKEDMQTFGLLEREKELKGSYVEGLEALYKKYLIKKANSPEEKSYKNNVEKLEKLLKSKGLTDLNLMSIKLKATKEAIKEDIKEQIKRQMNKKKEE